MNLYLIRHADALPLGENGITDDAERPLSPVGEKQAQEVGNVLRKKGIILDRVVSSPLVRAKQTTDLLLKGWEGGTFDVRFSEELEPGAKPRKLAKFLRRLGGEHVALIGHQPHMGFWAGWLVGSKKAHIEIAKAGVAHIVCEDGPRKASGTLQWLVTPAWFE